jgi:hypothetical protein
MAPIYRWPGLKEPVGFYMYSPYMAVYISVSLLEYNTIQLLYRAYVSMGLYPMIAGMMAPEKSWWLVECPARWEPQEEGMMNTAARFSLS